MREFLQKIKGIYLDEDYQFIKYAAEYAEEMHSGQFRVSGEPYINHPIAVATILADYGMDATTISAALLHDVLEDTPCTDDDLKRKFGEQIYNLVEGVTKLSKIKFASNEEAQAENYRKMFFAIAQDVRVLFIKLADRLHNMRTLGALRPDKQQRIAHETLDLYAPLAGRLGIAQIKSEMEDLSMKYLYPAEYENLKNEVDKRMGERMGFVMRIANQIELGLNERGIKGEVKGRPKHLYSIFKKMQNQNKTLDQIYDLIAVRVIVETVEDCYAVLGLIHSVWVPMPGRFKDYIAMPKPNLYKSLHTTVITNFGQVFEIQIRTYEMNRIAEYGIAAHWKYKEGKANEKNSEFDEKLGWIKEVMDVEKDVNNSQEFLNTLKMNIFSHEVYVFTPKGLVLNLPKNATCIDFAYKVHSEVGNHCVGAKINSKIVPLNTQLVSGDIVEIITSQASRGPSRDWLKIATTTQAKSKIKLFFKKELQTENIKLGKDMMEREAKRRGYALSDLIDDADAMDKIFFKYSFASIDDMYASIGYGGISTNQILLKLIDIYKKQKALAIAKTQAEDIPQITENESASTKNKRHSGILVEGYDDFAIKLSKCCNPVPGDEIIGYAVRGIGVSIHRADCPNIKGMESERIMKARWTGHEAVKFVARLRLTAVAADGLLNQLVALLSSQGISITLLELHTKQKGESTIDLGIQVSGTDDLDLIIKKLDSLPNINSVSRSK